MNETRGSAGTTRRLGDLLFVGFDGTEMTVDLDAFLREIRPGGIILFKRNIVSPEQALALVSSLRSLYEPRPIIAVDEEGGQVSRLRPVAPTLPPAARLAALGDPGVVRSLAASLGRVLASIGFDLDFTPVVDLCREDAPNGIGDRSYGTDPELVVTMARACLDGLADAGIAGCLKHFPGLGPTLFDSHHHLPPVQKERDAFLAEDLLPYRRLHAAAPVVMVGHGHYPFMAGANPVAATLTPAVATDLLRAGIGFEGLALADDLEMKAVSARIPYGQLAPRVLAAGCDMALVCRDRTAVRTSLHGIREWAADGRLPASRLDEARRRVQTLRDAVTQERGRTTPSLDAFRTACGELESGLARIA